MTFGQRFLLMLFIVLAIMFALAMLGYYSGGWEDDPPPLMLRFNLASAETVPEPTCVVDEETRERIRNIMIDSLDEALHDQIKALFQIWMKDERGQPDRAKVGARAAIKAHQTARKSALEWMPPLCP